MFQKGSTLTCAFHFSLSLRFATMLAVGGGRRSAWSSPVAAAIAASSASLLDLCLSSFLSFFSFLLLLLYKPPMRRAPDELTLTLKDVRPR